MLFEDLLADLQAQPHAVPHLGSVERLKYVGHHVCRDARTVVGESNLDAGRTVAGVR
jgi:hypothetical protein